MKKLILISIVSTLLSQKSFAIRSERLSALSEQQNTCRVQVKKNFKKSRRSARMMNTMSPFMMSGIAGVSILGMAGTGFFAPLIGAVGIIGNYRIYKLQRSANKSSWKSKEKSMALEYALLTKSEQEREKSKKYLFGKFRKAFAGKHNRYHYFKHLLEKINSKRSPSFPKLSEEEFAIELRTLISAEDTDCNKLKTSKISKINRTQKKDAQVQTQIEGSSISDSLENSSRSQLPLPRMQSASVRRTTSSSI